MRKYALAALFVLLMGTVVYAAPVGLTSEADATKGELWADKDIGITAGIIVDIVSERKISMDSGAFEMDAFLLRLGASYLDRVNVFVDLGTANDMEFSYTIAGQQYVTKFDDEFMWGIGANALIYRWDNDFEIGVHGSYRKADMNMEETTIDGVNHKRTSGGMTSIVDGDFTEIQGAVELAWKKELFTPYIGIKYSDVEVDARFTLYGTLRDANDKNAVNNVGIFLGLTMTPNMDSELFGERLAINVEGRFIDEEAISIAASYRF